MKAYSTQDRANRREAKVTNQDRIERLRRYVQPWGNETIVLDSDDIAAALAVIEKWEKELSAIAESGSICNKWAQRQLALLDEESP